jgi:hypothetical protein
MAHMAELAESPAMTLNPKERDCSAVREIIYRSIDALDEELRGLNRKVNLSRPNISKYSNNLQLRYTKVQSYAMKSSKHTTISPPSCAPKVLK